MNIHVENLFPPKTRASFPENSTRKIKFKLWSGDRPLGDSNEQVLSGNIFCTSQVPKEAMRVLRFRRVDQNENKLMFIFESISLIEHNRNWIERCKILFFATQV